MSSPLLMKFSSSVYRRDFSHWCTAMLMLVRAPQWKANEKMRAKMIKEWIQVFMASIRALFPFYTLFSCVFTGEQHSAEQEWELHSAMLMARRDGILASESKLFKPRMEMMIVMRGRECEDDEKWIAFNGLAPFFSPFRGEKSGVRRCLGKFA